MKQLFLLLLIGIVLPGCIVCKVSYKTQDQITTGVSFLKKDNLSIGCDLVSTDNKRLDIILTFDGYKTKIGVKNISITVMPNDNNSLTLDNVKMAPLKFVNSPVFEETHKKLKFSDLPDDYKFTVFNGENVYYDFYYKSSVPISSESLEITFFIELENGEMIKFTERFIRTKHCYFAVH